MSIKDTLMKRNKEKKEETINARDYITSKYQKKESDKFGLDTLDADLRSMNDVINSVYSGWQGADYMASTKKDVSAMYDRLKGYKDYTNRYGTGDLTEFNTQMDALLSGYSSALSDWDDLTNVYSGYKDADSYTKETNKLRELSNMTTEELKAKIDSGESPYAYTTYGGQDITWESLYKDKLHADMATSKEGAEGWEKYLADMEAKKASEKKKSWLETYIATTPIYDTTTPGGMFSQVVHDKRKDTSYKEPTDEWTDEERNIFGAYYLTDTAKAYEYATSVNNAKNLAKENAQKGTITDSATSGIGAGALHTAGSILTAPFGLADYLDDLTSFAAGRPILSDGFVSPFEYSQTVQSGISEELNSYGTLNEKIPVIGGKGWGDVYGLGTTIAQSAASKPLGAVGVLMSYFGQGAASGVDDALSRGATDGQALLYGSTQGALEGALEAAVNIKFKNLGAASIPKALGSKMLEQGVNEATEEGLTTLLGNVADAIIMRDKSAFNNAVRTHEANGEKNPIGKALLEVGEDIIYDALGGFVSGGVQAGPAVLYNTSQLGSTVRENNNIEELGSLASELNSDGFKKYIDAIEKGNISNLQLGSLYEAVSNETQGKADKATAEPIMRAVADRAIELGDSKNSGIIASAIQKNMQGQKLSAEEKSALKSDTAQTIMEEIKKDGLGIKISDEMKSASNMYERTEAVYTTKDATKGKKIGNQTVDNKSGAEINIEGMSLDNDGNMVLETSEGTRSVDDITVTYADSQMLDIAKEYEAETEGKGDLFASLYDGKTDIKEYKASFDMMYNHGELATGDQNITQHMGVLNSKQAIEIYKSGLKNSTVIQQKKVDAVVEKYRKENPDFTPGTFDDSKVNYKNLTKTQKSYVAFTRDFFTKFTGANVVMYESFLDEKGNRVMKNDDGTVRKAPNGWYDPSTNSIYLDVHAGIDERNKAFESGLITTLSHETTHWMKEKSPTAWKNLANAALNTLAEAEGKSIDELIMAERGRLSARDGKLASKEAAIDELVARACEDMLGNSERVHDYLARMDAETRQTFVEKVRGIIQKLKKWMSELLGAYKSNSAEAQAIRKMAENLDNIEQLWSEAFMQAIETNQAMQNTESEIHETNPKKQYSVREIIGPSGKSYGIGVYLDSNELTELTDMERKEKVKNLVKNKLSGNHFIAYDKNGDAVDVMVAPPQYKTLTRSGRKKQVIRELYDKNGNLHIKQEAILHVDELLATANKVDEQPSLYSHGMLDNYGKNTWDYWQVFIQEPNGNVWIATLNIVNSMKNQKILYDINPLDMVEGAVKSATHSTNGIVDLEEDSVKQNSDRVQYDKPITSNDVEVLRSIGRKSVNEFTSEDIQKSQKWAYKFFKELGVKSPFFRAWFGDWRSEDKTPLTPIVMDTSAVFKSGNATNVDTGEKMSWNSEMQKESILNASKDNKADVETIVANIARIVENGILLDTTVSTKSSNRKLEGTSWMHSFYSVAQIDDRVVLLKLYAENAFSEKQNLSFTRAYSLKHIKKIAEIDNGVLILADGLTESHSTISINSVSDLFHFVKRYDKDFHPKPVNSAMLNENGTPKVFYHQTDADFTVFNTDNERAGRFDTETPTGMFFKTDSSDIGISGNKQMQVYLHSENMLEFANREEAHRYWMHNIDGYRELQKKYDEIDTRYGKLYDEKEAETDAWYDEHYDDFVAGNISEKEVLKAIDEPLDEILSAWKREQEPIARKMKALVTSYFRESGYDGMHLRYDGTRNSVDVDTYIVFEPTQIKSATDNIGTFDASESDIRYSDRDTQSAYEILDENRRYEAEVDKIITDHKLMQKKVEIEKKYTKVTPNYEQLSSEASMLIKHAGSSYDKVTLAKELKSVYKGIQSGEDWNITMSKLMDIAEGVLKTANETIDLTDSYADVVINKYIENEAKWHLAVEMYNRLWNIYPVKTMSEKHRSDIKQLKAEHRRELDLLNLRKSWMAAKDKNELRKKVTKAREDALEEGKKKFEEYKEKDKRRSKINAITKKALTLNEWLVKNNKDKHIPEPMKDAVIQLVASIDFSSKQMLSDTGKKAHQPTKKDIAINHALAGLRKAAEDIKKGEAEAKENGSVYLDLDLPDSIVETIGALIDRTNNLAKQYGDATYVLNHMTYDELDSLDEVITILKGAISKANKSFVLGQDMLCAEIAKRLIEFSNGLSEKKMDNDATAFLEYKNTTPYYMLKRLGPEGERIFNALMDAQDKLVFIEDEIERFVGDTVNAEKIKEWSEEIHEFTIKGILGKDKKIQMTTAQMMSLYCLNERDAAKLHLEGGGIRMTDIKVNMLKTIKDHFGTSLSSSDLANILSALTKEQKDVAIALRDFMSTRGSDLGNEVTLARWDIKQLVETKYFPMDTVAQDGNLDNIGNKENSIYRLLNMNFMKSLTPNANNQLIIDNIFDVFTRHMTEMAKYNAFALPLLDTLKVLGYSEKVFLEEGSVQHETISVAKSIKRAFGQSGYGYIVNLLKDLNGTETTPRDEGGVKTLMANFKIAAVGNNLRVMALQGTAYVKALLVMDGKYLAKALGTNPFNGINSAMENSGIALWKSKGHYDINIAQSTAKRIKHDENWRDKVIDLSMKGAEWGDKLTWGYLWNACELWAKDNTAYKHGSEEFNKAVSNKLREIIVRTQVVDSTLTRSQMMRNKSVSMQTLTAFMSESTMTYNYLSDAFFEWNLDARKDGNSYKSTFAKHGKNFAKSVGVFTLSAFATALSGAFFDTLRDDEEEKEFDEKYLENFLKSLGDSMNVFSTLPFFRDIVSIKEGYTPSRYETQSVATLYYAYRKWIKVFEGDGNVYQASYKTLQGLSQLTGLPFSNLVRDVVAMWNSTIGEVYPSLKIEQ